MRLIKSSFACLLFSFVVVGCGGGPKLPIPPPGQPQPIASLTANPTRVRSGETVLLRLSATPEPLSVVWLQEPAEPLGEFQADKAAWIAPVVSTTVQFRIIARIVFSEGVVLTPSVSIVVDPKEGEPSVIPPRVVVYYPLGPPYNVVANGQCVLQVQAKILAGTNPVVNLEVLVDGRVVETLTNPPADFSLDVSDFGSLGTKDLILRAIDSTGVSGGSRIEIHNDPVELERLAVEFLRKYSTAGGRLVRFGDLQDGPYTQPVYVWLYPGVESYLTLVEQACRFWTRYTHVNFVILQSSQRPPTDLCIVIKDKFLDDPGIAAEARRGYSDSFRISSGFITLYRGWVESSPDHRLKIIAHEIGHIILTLLHTSDNSVMDQGGAALRLHSFQQKAVRLLYTSSPGDQL